MFGTLKLRGCCTSDEVRGAQQRYYCGLCQAMGRGYGQPLRALHSHDGVFVAALADGLLVEPAEHGTTVCPMLPVLRKPSLDPDSPALGFAAAIQLLLGDQWLADKQVEGRRAAGAGRRLMSSRVARARARLEGLGVDLSALQGFEGRQAAVEVPGVGAEVAAEPTSEALSLVFAALADLPGADADRAPLARLGRHLGRAIYMVDALEDCGDDARTGAFNPCCEAGEVSQERVEGTIALLEQDRAALRSVVDELPLRRNRELVAELLGPSLAHRMRAATEAARQATSGASRAERARWREMSPVQRFGHAAALLLLSLWTFLVGLPEALAGRAEPVASSCDQCGNNCGDKCCSNCGDSCGNCEGCCDSCKGCGDSCGGCTEACESCCESCPGTLMFFRR